MNVRQLFKAVWQSVLMLAVIIVIFLCVSLAITFLPGWLNLTILGVVLFAWIVFMNYRLQ